jgi:hypothetical protein
MLKGSIANILVLIALMLTPFIVFSDVTPAWYEGQKSGVVLHRDIYMMDNALDAAKSYIDTALSYSAYQACYDTLRRTDMSAAETVFKKELEDSIKIYLNRYVREDYYFMSIYPVTIPEYTIVTIKTLSPLKIRAESPSEIFISKEDKGKERKIKTNSTLEKTMKIDCYGIYNKGKEIHINTKYSIGNEIKTMTDSWPKGPIDTKPSETDRENELKGINVGSERTEGNYHIKPVFEEADVSITYTENKATGKFEDIKYKITVALRVTIHDNRTDQVFPIYDGTKIAFAPLSAEFLFRESYST